jgi:hypothetical protein
MENPFMDYGSIPLKGNEDDGIYNNNNNMKP